MEIGSIWQAMETTREPTATLMLPSKQIYMTLPEAIKKIGSNLLPVLN